MSAPSVASSGPAAADIRRQVSGQYAALRTLRGLLDQALPWISLAIGLIVWEVVGQTGAFSFLPPVSAVLAAFWTMATTGRLDALGVTLQSLAIGYALSVALGVATGVVMARNRLVQYVLDPYIDAFMTIPSSALIPVYLVIFGLGAEARVAVVFMHTYFVIVVNTVAGAKAVDANLVEMARAFGAREGTLLRKVVLPAALPLLVTGLRLGFGRAVRGIINAETILASVGIGQLLIRYGRTFQMENLYSTVLVIVIVAVVGTTAIGFVERSSTRWQRASA